MSNFQLAKFCKLIKTIRPTKHVNVSIYIHEVSKKRADEIMRCIPKSFRRGKKKATSGTIWKDAEKSNVYGFGRIDMTVFYPRGKEVSK